MVDVSSTIYGLTDPDTRELRYVGVTVSRIERRLNNHISDTRRGPRCHNHNWIASLLARGVRPEVFALESGLSIDEAIEAERFWIAYFRSLGCGLTNGTEGGDGSSGKRSPETRARISAAGRGRKWTQEHRSAWRRGWELRSETAETTRRAKISSSQKGISRTQVTVESRAAMSAAHVGKSLTVDHKLAIAAAMRKAWTRPEIRARIVGGHDNRRS